MSGEAWDHRITPTRSNFHLGLRALWNYRFLTFLFFRRDIVANYKQTVLGPIWFLIQPILTTVIFTLIFGKFAGFAPEGIPQPLFFLSGVVGWNYFTEVFTKTSNLFRQNAAIFGKVYFPRLTVPLSLMLAGIVKFLIQFLLLIGVFIYYYSHGEVQPNWKYMWLIIPNVFLLGWLAMSMGNIFSALTAKYRDFTHLVGFGVQLLMYTTTVIYPLPKVLEWAQQAEGNGISWQKVIVYCNPITPVMESFRIAFCNYGVESMPWSLYGLAWIFTLVLFLFSIIVFNKTEQNFMDTV